MPRVSSEMTALFRPLREGPFQGTSTGCMNTLSGAGADCTTARPDTLVVDHAKAPAEKIRISRRALHFYQPWHDACKFYQPELHFANCAGAHSGISQTLWIVTTLRGMKRP
jgi:hypothetical protein